MQTTESISLWNYQFKNNSSSSTTVNNLTGKDSSSDHNTNTPCLFCIKHDEQTN